MSIHSDGFIAFENQHPLFQDHFPHVPCVPGSIIIEALRRQVTAVLGNRPVQVKRFRFLHFVTPGTYAYKIEGNEETNTVSCLLGTPEKPLAEGRFIL